MATRDFAASKVAWVHKDIEKSMEAHEKKLEPTARESHAGEEGDFVKSIIYGGLDGIMTTFATIAAVAGSKSSPKLAVLLALARLASGSIAMGLGDYLSEIAEVSYIKDERKRETWEFENHPQGEKKEMVELYVSKGVSEEDAIQVIDRLAKYKDFFIDHMMTVELGLLPPGDLTEAWKMATATFLAFILFGGVPIVVCAAFIGSTFHEPFNVVFLTASIFTGLTLFALGATKAYVCSEPVISNGTIMFLNGAVVAAAAYLLGMALNEILPVKVH